MCVVFSSGLGLNRAARDELTWCCEGCTLDMCLKPRLKVLVSLEPNHRPSKRPSCTCRAAEFYTCSFEIFVRKNFFDQDTDCGTLLNDL